jgi:hypothetical protein
LSGALCQARVWHRIRGLVRLRPRPRPAGTPAKPFNLELAHGDLLLMEPPTQLWWQHALPRRLRLQQERLNLTFRVVR